ncbi:aromatic ring-hydroxylating dioxygenase subunit alpha, partial [Streptomyces sp. NPDC003832]
RYGLVFVYMGPPERKPELPRWDCLEDLEDGESYFASFPVPGFEVTGAVSDFNWLQAYENAVDPVHAAWLHSGHSGFQFDGVGTPTGLPESYFDNSTIAERVTYERTDYGVKYVQKYQADAPEGEVGAELEWQVEVQVPNIIGLPDFVQPNADARHDMLIWIVPVDDTTQRAFFSARATDPGRMMRLALGIKQNGKFQWELSEDEAQRFPGDYEAQRSQGDITLHSEETLAPSDRGVVMLRRMLRTMMDDVEAGRDPQGVHPVKDEIRRVESGVVTVKAGAAATAGA